VRFHQVTVLTAELVRGRGPGLLPGGPCSRITGLPSGSPDDSTQSRRPSTART